MVGFTSIVREKTVWSMKRLAKPVALAMPVAFTRPVAWSMPIVLTMALTAGWTDTAHAAEPEPIAMADLAITVGEVLLDDYYDPSRFQPVLMVERALQALESVEVSIDLSWQDDQITMQMGTEKVQWIAPRPVDVTSAFALLDELRHQLAKGPYDAHERRDMSYALLNGALQVLDPHTVLIPPQPADKFAEEIDGEFFGIGAYLTEEDGIVAIERVMAGLPAERYGVRDGDVILAVDGEKTMGLSLPQTVKRIKGPKDSTVVLTVEREGHAEPLELSIVRELVQYITMGSKRVGDIGYLQMNEFNKLTYRDLVDNILKLQRADNKPIRGFVLDLRYNGGGLLKQAQLVTDLFLPPSKQIVRTVMPDREPFVMMSNRRMIIDVPLVVLTSSGSASASEIVAGALQLNQRAVVVGSTTFGKGSVQTIRGIADGSQLKFTIQEYQLRDGASIQGRGVVPDVELLRHSQHEDGVVDMVPYSSRREDSHEFALIDQGTYQEKTAVRVGWLQEYVPPETRRERHSIASPQFEPDPEASLVIQMMNEALRGPDVDKAAREALAQGQARSFLIDRLRGPAAQQAQREDTDLAAVFASQGQLTWGQELRPSADDISVSYTGPDEITAGDTVALTFDLQNHSEAPVGKLFGVIRGPDTSPLWESEVLFGQVAPGTTSQATLMFDVPPRMVQRLDKLSLELFYSSDVTPLESYPFDVQYVPRAAPHLSYQWVVLEGAGAGAGEGNANPDGQIALDEEVTLQLTVMNQGDGDSVESILYLYKDNDQHVQLGEGRIRLDPIPAGGQVQVDVPLQVRSSVTSGKRDIAFEGDHIKLQVRLEERFEQDVDQRFRASLFHSLDIPLNQQVIGGVIQQPKLTVLQQEHVDNELQLSLQIIDDNIQYLTIFNDEDKVLLLNRDDILASESINAQIPLTEGLNNIRVIAYDQDEVSDVAFVYAWRQKSEASSDGDVVAERTIQGTTPADQTVQEMEIP